MDANKLRVLHEIGYEIRESCGLCVHFQSQPGSAFGVCAANTYVHEKHTGPPRDLSVHTSGRCADGFEATVVAFERLGGFADLVEDT